MVSNLKLTIVNLLLLYCNYETVFGFKNDSTAEKELRADLESIVDVRRKLLKAGAMNPEIFRAAKQWDISPKQETSFKSDLSNTEQCDLDLLDVVEGLINPSPGGVPWAFQVLDSFGKPAAGLLRGRVSWPGSFDECLQVSAPSANNTAKGFHYAWLSFSFQTNKSTGQSVAVNSGACFPNSCSEDSILQLYNSTSELLDYIFFWEKVSSKLPKLGVKFVQDKHPLSTASVACICVCGLFAALVFTGTIVDAVKRWKDKQMLLNVRSPSIVDDPICSDVGSSNADQTDGIDTTKLFFIAEYKSKSVARDFLLCFSAISNSESILNTKSSEGQLLCVHGIRFFSMAWVILGHTYYFGLGLYGNLLDLIEKIDTWPIQVILQGTYSVDTFFLLSGFLLTYLFLKNKEKFVGCKSWVMFYVHRYVRLTPAYAMVMFVLATWFNNLGNGPYWTIGDQLVDTCSKSWWWHILYINNFMDSINMCVGWAWYLANDMQFFVISPLFLIAFKRNRTAGLLIVLVLLVASWIATGVISRVYNIAVIFANINGVSESELAEQQGDMFDKMYTKPYTRIGPYLIGVLLGCLLDMANGRKKFLHKSVVIVGWLLSQALSLTLLYGLLKSHLGPITESAHNSLARSAWGVSVGWVIYACLTGHAGPVNTLLSWKVWVPLSRLTYCAYLVHPLIMMWYFGSLRTPIFYTNSEIVIMYLSLMCLSYGMAFITSLLFEAPIMKLEKFIKNL